MSNLSSREKKFLANHRQMAEIFGDFVPQGAVFYEFCRGYDIEERCFERLGAARVRMYRGMCKPRLPNASVKQNKMACAQSCARGRVNVCNFVTPLACLRYSVWSGDAKLARRECRQKNRAEAVSLLGIKFYSFADIAKLHWLIYREFGWVFAPRVLRVLDERSVRLLDVLPTPPKCAEQVVDFVGQYALAGYSVGIDGAKADLLWQNIPLKMLDAGIESLIATVCVESDFEVNGGTSGCRCGSAAILAKIRRDMPNLAAFCLAGLWNAVADDELVRQHFGVGGADEEIWQATERFKQYFADYICSVLGNNFDASKKQKFSAEIGKNVVKNYLGCVTFCVQQYANWSRRKIRHSAAWGRFAEFLEYATKCDFDAVTFGQFAAASEGEKEKFAFVLNSKLAVIRNTFGEIVMFDKNSSSVRGACATEKTKRAAKARTN